MLGIGGVVLIWILVAIVVGEAKSEECKVYTEGTIVRKHQPSDSVVRYDYPQVPRRVGGFQNLSVYYEEVDGGRVMKLGKKPEFTFVAQPTDRGGVKK
jgi:hypothetical protein